jgi:hypothetical protein
MMLKAALLISYSEQSVCRKRHGTVCTRGFPAHPFTGWQNGGGLSEDEYPVRLSVSLYSVTVHKYYYYYYYYYYYV